MESPRKDPPERRIRAGGEIPKEVTGGGCFARTRCTGQRGDLAWRHDAIQLREQLSTPEHRALILYESTGIILEGSNFIWRFSPPIRPRLGQTYTEHRSRKRRYLSTININDQSAGWQPRPSHLDTMPTACYVSAFQKAPQVAQTLALRKWDGRSAALWMLQQIEKRPRGRFRTTLNRCSFRIRMMPQQQQRQCFCRLRPGIAATGNVEAVTTG